MCSRDVLFWLNSFVWTYDPRLVSGPNVVPFVTWEAQDRAIEVIDAELGYGDVAVDKSRDEGASWIFVAEFVHRWIFDDMASFLLVSRKWDLVYKQGDPDSLFWKAQFIVDHLPAWIRPSYRIVEGHLENLENGSVIDGEATTGDVSTGGRRLSMLFDEFAKVPVSEAYDMLKASRDVTQSRMFNSTQQGTAHPFAELTDGNRACLVVELNWWDDPRKNKGLYRWMRARLEKLDKGFVYPPKFTFRPNDEYTTDGCEGYEKMGRPRSPWFDHECDRAGSPREIAEQLNRSKTGSDYQFFDPSVLNRLLLETVRPPYAVGEIEYHTDTLQPIAFDQRASGRYKLWTAILPDTGRPADDRRYCIGVDVAEGTGATPTVFSVGDCRTGEKVCEFASIRVMPHDAAQLGIVLARLFHNALLIWEANGAGATFGNCVIDLGYHHVYMRRSDKSLSKKISDVPGWWSSGTSKVELLGEYRRALSSGAYINHSVDAVVECKSYIFHGKTVIHSGSVGGVDPASTGENHGDRVIADALCWHALKDHVSSQPGDTKRVVPANSLAGRRQSMVGAQRENKHGWPRLSRGTR